MTEIEFEIIKNSDSRQIIEKYIDEDPVRVAFKLSGNNGAILSTQIKYLQRCKTKLPAYYAARCVIPPISYEQCSSEAAAATKNYGGELCIDLTCGLGVDSLNFSRRFTKVIAIERDPLLAQVARYNFSLLGAYNVEVVNMDAEEFLSNYHGAKADLIFADPSRRSVDNKRVFLLEDCSPNVVELMPQIVKCSKKAVLKLSPLFDIDEVFRLFSKLVTKVEVVSIANECKEVVVELSEAEQDCEIVVSTSKGVYSFMPEEIGLKVEKSLSSIEDYNYLLIPDSALVKARLTVAYVEKYMTEDTFISGFIFTKELPNNFCGRVFRINRAEGYNPKQIKKELKQRKIKRANIIRRNFASPTNQIIKDLGLSEGGELSLGFTEIDGKNYIFFLETT